MDIEGEKNEKEEASKNNNEIFEEKETGEGGEKEDEGRISIESFGLRENRNEGEIKKGFCYRCFHCFK